MLPPDFRNLILKFNTGATTLLIITLMNVDGYRSGLDSSAFDRMVVEYLISLCVLPSNRGNRWLRQKSEGSNEVGNDEDGERLYMWLW